MAHGSVTCHNKMHQMSRAGWLLHQQALSLTEPTLMGLPG